MPRRVAQHPNGASRGQAGAGRGRRPPPTGTAWTRHMCVCVCVPVCLSVLRPCSFKTFEELHRSTRALGVVRRQWEPVCTQWPKTLRAARGATAGGMCPHCGVLGAHRALWWAMGRPLCGAGLVRAYGGGRQELRVAEHD